MFSRPYCSRHPDLFETIIRHGRSACCEIRRPRFSQIQMLLEIL